MTNATAPSPYCPSLKTWWINIHECHGSLMPSFHLSRDDADRNALWNRVACYEHTCPTIPKIPKSNLNMDQVNKWNAEHKDKTL